MSAAAAWGLSGSGRAAERFGLAATIREKASHRLDDLRGQPGYVAQEMNEDQRLGAVGPGDAESPMAAVFEPPAGRQRSKTAESRSKAIIVPLHAIVSLPNPQFSMNMSSTIA